MTPFCKVRFSCRSPLQAFFFFVSYLLRVGRVISMLFLQHKLSKSWGGELLSGAQTLVLWGCCPGFCLFIYCFNKGQNGCRWVGWTFLRPFIYGFIFYIKSQQHTISFSLRNDKKNAALTDIFFSDSVDISALSSAIKPISVVEVVISEG